MTIGSTNCPVATQSTTQLTCTIPALTGSQTVNVTENGKSGSKTGLTLASLASLSVSNTSHNFNSLKINQTLSETFTITNGGGVAAASVSYDGLAAPYSKTGGTCGTTIAAGASCTVIIAFTPTAASNDQSDDLDINYNNGQASASVSIGLLGDGLPVVTKLSLGFKHTCALMSTGKIKCWGADFGGQLGDDNTIADQTAPVEVAGISTATDVAAGQDRTCAVLSDGTAKCWGQYLAPGDTTSHGTPQTVADISDAASVSIGSNGQTVCFARTNKGIKCLGENSAGQFGNGLTADSTTLMSVANFPAAYKGDAIAIGRNHGCALDEGDVRCWGNNSYKQIGTDSTNTNYTVATQISGISSATAIWSGDNHSCATFADKSLKCWGANNKGQLATGSIVSTVSNLSADPETTLLTGVEDVGLGSAFGCAVLTGGAVKCWGEAHKGQLGNNNDSSTQATPVSVSGLTTGSKVAVGYLHACSLTTDAKVYCWGWGSNYQVGDGDNDDELVPVLVSGI